MSVVAREPDRSRERTSSGMLRWPALIAVLLTTACAHAPLSPALAGDYQLHGVPETASALRLTPDGKYRFALSLGSVDEYDEGSWRIDGSDVILRSTVADDAPGFSFVRSGRDSQP